jgi:hypothetical protein
MTYESYPINEKDQSAADSWLKLRELIELFGIDTVSDKLSELGGNCHQCGRLRMSKQAAADLSYQHIMESAPTCEY